MGNPFAVFSQNPKNMPGQGLAETNNYSNEGAASQYSELIKSLYGNQGYMLAQERMYDPQWLALQNQLGQEAQRNTLSLYGQSLPQLQAYQNSANAAAINSVATNLGAYQSINPAQSGLYDSLLNSASEQVAMGSQLRPNDVYNITNGVRTDFANRGLGNSNAAQLAEAMSLYGAGEQTYQNRLASAQQLGAAASNFYSPLYAFLNQANTLPGQAMNLTSYAQGVGNNAGPNQFNAATQANLLNSVYGQLQQNNRTQAQLETGIGQQQAEIWNDWFKTAAGAGAGAGGGGMGGGKG